MTQPMQMPYGAQESLDSPSADLSSWDFLQDVDLAFDHNLYAANAASTSVTDTYSKERLKEKNRQAQKRARQRKKASLHSLQCFCGTVSAWGMYRKDRSQ